MSDNLTETRIMKNYTDPYATHTLHIRRKLCIWVFYQDQDLRIIRLMPYANWAKSTISCQFESFKAFVKSCSFDSRNDQKVQHVKWCMTQTKLTSEISCPTDSCLAQLVRHWPEDPEALVSNPTGGNFWWIYFALPCVKICQIIWQNRLSWKTQLATIQSVDCHATILFTISINSAKVWNRGFNWPLLGVWMHKKSPNDFSFFQVNGFTIVKSKPNLNRQVWSKQLLHLR